MNISFPSACAFVFAVSYTVSQAYPSGCFVPPFLPSAPATPASAIAPKTRKPIRTIAFSFHWGSAECINRK